MTRKSFYILLLSACFGVACLMSQAQVRVRKSARDFTKNPTIIFNGIKGSSAMSSAVGSFLNACGWFDLRRGGTSDYTLDGVYSGKYLDMTVKQSGISVYRLKVPIINNDLRRAARKGVDAILKKLFKIKGVCSSRIAFCAETGRGIKNIYVCDIDGKGVKKITNFRSLCVEPEWFPDGKSLVYTTYNKASTDIVQTRISPRMSRRLASYPGINVGASISPNGKYLALILSRDRQVELYVKALNGRAKRRLTYGKAVEASPCWSPGGGSLCFVSDRSGRPGLFVVGANGGSARRLPTTGSEAVSPAWSSDNQIVYSARMGYSYTLAVLDLNGQKQGGSVINAAGDWESPSWAPDNRHVVCSRTYGGRSSLYVVDTWTGKARKLARISNNLSMPCWSKLQ